MIHSHATTRFLVIREFNTLQRQLALAKASHCPVLIDFYATWCPDCVAMDHHVFDLASVKQALYPFVLIRVDLSDNTPDEQRILSYFHVIAPPAIIFFNEYGNEVMQRRIMGELNANEFLRRIHSFFEAGCDKNAQC